MKKLLLFLSILAASLMLGSCEKLFGGDKEDENDENQMAISLTIASDVIAGRETTLDGYVPEEYRTQGYKILFGTEQMELNERQGGVSVRVPAGMKGRYDVVFVSGAYSRQIGCVNVYEYLGTAYPGTVYRIDLSNAHTIFSTVVESSDDMRTTRRTMKFGAGTQPVDVKFYNALDREVIGSIETIQDISPDFFYCTLSFVRNERDLLFDLETFTCDPSRQTGSDIAAAVVEKQSGIVTVLQKEDKDQINLMYISQEFQWMGGRTFCFTDTSYGVGEFTRNKLFKFEIPEFPDKSIFTEDMAEFYNTASLKLLPGQDNVDICNLSSGHWVAADEWNVYFNQQRALIGGNLSSVSNVSTSVPVFACYPSRSISCISRRSTQGAYMAWITSLVPIVGGVSHEEYDCDCTYDIYQYPDSTYLRARTDKVGNNIHSYSIGKDFFREYTESVIKLETPVSPVTDIFPHYPCTSAYEYYVSDDDRELIRRKISGRNNDEVIYRRSSDAWWTRWSASAHAVSIVTMQAGGVNEVFRIAEINAAGNKVQEFSLDPGVRVFGICRLGD